MGDHASDQRAFLSEAISRDSDNDRYPKGQDRRAWVSVCELERVIAPHKVMVVY